MPNAKYITNISKIPGLSEEEKEHLKPLLRSLFFE